MADRINGTGTLKGARNVRFGSKADIRAAKCHVRFTPNSDRNSGPPLNAMSALPPKADMCGANRHVCFGPKADIVSYLLDHLVGERDQRGRYGEAEGLGGLPGQLRKSNLVDCMTGRSAGFSPLRIRAA
jgi:hypothetical protein